jgi:hypothetical protein
MDIAEWWCVSGKLDKWRLGKFDADKLARMSFDFVLDHVCSKGDKPHPALFLQHLPVDLQSNYVGLSNVGSTDRLHVLTRPAFTKEV